MTDERTTCSVAMCHRTTKGRWAWWFCGVHWRSIDPALKLLMRRLRARYRKRGELVKSCPRGWTWTSERGWRSASGLFKRMAKDAFERSAGI